MNKQSTAAQSDYSILAPSWMCIAVTSKGTTWTKECREINRPQDQTCRKCGAGR